jgi:hypothetical protein
VATASCSLKVTPEDPFGRRLSPPGLAWPHDAVARSFRDNRTGLYARFLKELGRRGHRVCPTVVGRVLRAMGYSLQANSKTREGDVRGVAAAVIAATVVGEASHLDPEHRCGVACCGPGPGRSTSSRSARIEGALLAADLRARVEVTAYLRGRDGGECEPQGRRAVVYVMASLDQAVRRRRQ